MFHFWRTKVIKHHKTSHMVKHGFTILNLFMYTEKTYGKSPLFLPSFSQLLYAQTPPRPPQGSVAIPPAQWRGRRRGGSFLKKQKIPSLLRFLWDTLGDMLDLFLNEFESFWSYWMMLDHFLSSVGSFLDDFWMMLDHDEFRSFLDDVGPFCNYVGYVFNDFG